MSLKRAPRGSCAIWLKDGPSSNDVGDHLIDLYARERGSTEGDTNYLVVNFPWRMGESGAAHTLVSLTHAMLDTLPFYSAYLGYRVETALATVSPYSAPIADRVFAAVSQYRGLETYKPHLENYEMRHAIRPPTWVTFLSFNFVRELGGIGHLEREFDSRAVKFRTLQQGLSVQIGPKPVLADAHRGEDVPAEQKVLARLLSPRYSTTPALILGHRPHTETTAWLRRHLGAVDA